MLPSSSTYIIACSLIRRSWRPARKLGCQLSDAIKRSATMGALSTGQMGTVAHATRDLLASTSTINKG